MSPVWRRIPAMRARTDRLDHAVSNAPGEAVDAVGPGGGTGERAVGEPAEGALEDGHAGAPDTFSKRMYTNTMHDPSPDLSRCTAITKEHASTERTRAERKVETRRRLLDAALELVDERGFAALSLRELTRKAGITPAAFYRHFANTDELGLVLVDEAFGTLGAMLRDARTATVARRPAHRPLRRGPRPPRAQPPGALPLPDP